MTDHGTASGDGRPAQAYWRAIARIPGIPTTVLVAPDSFKGTLSATEVARAIAAGLQGAGHAVDLCAVADGGEGTLEALIHALGGDRRVVDVSDRLGRPVQASFGLWQQCRGRGAGRVVGVVETPAAGGLHQAPRAERDRLPASTHGTGQLLAAAAQAGAETIYLGVGGSAVSDGGEGALRAIREAGGLRGAQLVVLSDARALRTPFEDAVRVELEAEVVPGASFVLDAIGFDSRMRASRAVVTGEGKLDQQSLAGKLLSEVATRARQSGVPCHAIVGKHELDGFGARVLDLQAVLEASTPSQIEAAGRELAGVL